MGAVQSVIYPNDEPQKLDLSQLPAISVKKKTSGENIIIGTSVPEVNALEEHFEYQLDNLRAYINMYFLYDGYDHKNSVILKDLEKKFLNQKKEIKGLYEKKDKLRSNLDYSNEDLIKENKKNRFYTINIFILVIISIVLFVVNLINLRPYIIINSNLN
jgi:hypothetical protein